MPYETARDQWEAGLTRLAIAKTEERATLERVVRAIEAELRRRLGGAFTTDELVELYDEQGTGWCSDIAIAVAPDEPYAWDVRVVGDAAFGRYVRGATDFAGGRRLD